MASNAEVVKLKIDGRTVETKANSTVLDAARAAGVYVPTLCWDPVVKPFGACRLCVVEIDGAKGLPPSCCTTVTQGMVVRTDTQQLNKMRRGIMDLLTSLNRDQGITVIMVTHEADIAAYARRAIGFVDGRIASDVGNKEAA